MTAALLVSLAALIREDHNLPIPCVTQYFGLHLCIWDDWCAQVAHIVGRNLKDIRKLNIAADGICHKRHTDDITLLYAKLLSTSTDYGVHFHSPLTE